MRVRWMLVLAAVALMAFAPQSWAQQGQGRRGGRGGFGGMGGGMLLNNPGVQKELNLSDEQKEKIQTAVRDFMEKHRDDFGKLQDMSPEERREFVQKMQSEGRKAVAGILNSDQEKRLHQIELQQRLRMQPAEALTTGDVASKLKLSDEQKDKLKTIGEDAQKERRELFQNAGGGGNFQEMRQKMETLNKETQEKIQGVLNDQQKATLKELTGKPFEMQFGGRGGRRGGRRGQNQNQNQNQQ